MVGNAGRADEDMATVVQGRFGQRSPTLQVQPAKLSDPEVSTTRDSTSVTPWSDDLSRSQDCAPAMYSRRRRRDAASEKRGVRTMIQTVPYRQMGSLERGQAHTLFAQTMGYVAATAGLFALGAWLGRNLSGGVGIVGVHRRVRLPDRHAVRGPPVRPADRRAARGLRPADRAGRGADYRLLRQHGPARHCGRPAEPPRCSSPGSARRATPPGAT